MKIILFHTGVGVIPDLGQQVAVFLRFFGFFF